MRTETCRAIRMALYMESVPDGGFDITNWITRRNGVDVYPNTVDPSCGTVCCFIGHLPFAFPEDFGMHVKEIFHVYTKAPAFFGLTWEAMYGVVMGSHYAEGNAVSKSVVMGRFLDRVKEAHGIEDMDAMIAGVRADLSSPTIPEPSVEYPNLIDNQGRPVAGEHRS